MEADHRTFATEWANAVLGDEFARAHAMLAPWLRAGMSPSDLATMLEAARGGRPKPAQFGLEANKRTYEQLREPDGFPPRSSAFDPALTADNFRKWMCVEFRPADDDDDSGPGFDLWMAVVEVEGQLAVGYLEASEAD